MLIYVLSHSEACMPVNVLMHTHGGSCKHIHSTRHTHVHSHKPTQACTQMLIHVCALSLQIPNSK